MKAKSPKGKPGGTDPAPGAAAEELPERWSVQRKTELVMRLLRGEALDAVSRESQVPAHELERWQRIFLEQGKRGLRTKAEPEERDEDPVVNATRVDRTDLVANVADVDITVM